MNDRISVPALGTAPILCAPLLRQVDEALLLLLRSLEPWEWDLPTVVPCWNVRSIAAHLLDTAARKLSFVRDLGCPRAATTVAPAAVAQLVNRLNAEGVTVYGQLSPRVLADLLQVICRESAAFHESLDPFADACFAVSWAGEAQSLNWFDTARELTERWHHQQQIRLATNRPGIMVPEFYRPVLDCFLRGLPNLYRDVAAPVGTALLIEISGECGGQWLLKRASTEWEFVSELSSSYAAHVTIPQEIAWRIFTKGISRESAAAAVTFEGNAELGNKALTLTAVVA